MHLIMAAMSLWTCPLQSCTCVQGFKKKKTPQLITTVSMDEAEEPQLSVRTAGSLTLHAHSNVDPLVDDLRPITPPVAALSGPTQQGQCSPCQSTATAELPQFPALSRPTHLSLNSNGHVNNLVTRTGPHTRELQLRNLHSCLHCLDRLRHLSSHNNGHVNNHPRTVPGP